MSVLLLSFVAGVLASAGGAMVAFLFAGIPLDVLSRAARGGRYTGLAAGERTSPAGPSSGRRIPQIAATVYGVA